VTAAALRAVAKLVSTVGIGAYASKIGLLDKTALSILSKLIFSLLQPCLLFVNVASTCAKAFRGHGSHGGLNPVFFLPMVAAFQIFVGFTVGKFISFFMFRSGKDGPSDDEKQLLTCTTFGNSGPLPLVFVDALLKQHHNAAYLPQSVGFVSLYLLGWSPLFWIIAPAILSDEKAGGKTDWNVVGKRVFSPPVMGSLLGMVVGATPFLRRLLINHDGLFNPIFEAIRTLGAGYLPAVLLVLAGSLLPEASSPAAASSSGGGAVAAPSPSVSKFDWNLIKQIVSIYASRFVLMPMLAFSIVTALRTHFPGSAIVKLLQDKVLLFVLLLETCMPSAQNSTVILQLQKNTAGAAKMAKTLMIIYIAGVPMISYWIARILGFVNL